MQREHFDRLLPGFPGQPAASSAKATATDIPLGGGKPLGCCGGRNTDMRRKRVRSSDHFGARLDLPERAIGLGQAAAGRGILHAAADSGATVHPGQCRESCRGADGGC